MPLLKTINTPHFGCVWVERILNTIPKSVFYFIGNRYNKLFEKLGDKQPDFVSAVQDLTATKCQELDKKMIDQPNVYYQSVMSQMSKPTSSPFPLNLGYLLAKASDGPNDGLVGVQSAAHGHFLGVMTTKKKRGVSHGDVIDLNRADIPGYDVQEFYINLVKDLKEKGY